MDYLDDRTAIKTPGIAPILPHAVPERTHGVAEFVLFNKRKNPANAGVPLLQTLDYTIGFSGSTAAVAFPSPREARRIEPVLWPARARGSPKTETDLPSVPPASRLFLCFGGPPRSAAPPGAPEVAFVGRSNAGKSSSINVLCNQRRLAFSSKTPGRTRLINLFGLPDPLAPDQPLGFLVDLPGYGYASVAQREKEKWSDILGGYLRDRPSLAGIVLLIDIRRGVTDLDRRLADFIAPTGRPVLALLTKADKLPFGQRQRAVFAVRKELADIGALNTVPFSATERIGLVEAGQQIENWISPKVVP